MSRFADRIRSATRAKAQPIGFVASRASNPATMVLVGTARDAAAAAELARRGADAVLLGTAEAPAAAGSAKGLGDVITGAWIAGKRDDEARQFREAGFDFVVFDPDRAAAAALLDDRIGYVLRLPAGLTDVEVRAVEGFRLDALYIGVLDGVLTVRRQIDLQRLFALTRKPLIASVRPSVSPAELQALRDSNVAVVVLEGADAIERLRKAIDALPPRSRRKEDEHRTPFVPHTAAVGSGEEDEDDE